MGRGLIVLLFASLALNIFAIGFFSGRAIIDDRKPPMAGREHGTPVDSPFVLMKFSRNLPPDARDAFRSKIRGKLPTLRERHRDTQDLQKELAALIAADEFDRDAVAAKFSEIKSVHVNQRDAFNAAFIDALATLSAEERRVLVETAKEERGKRRRNFRDRRMRPE